MCRNETGTARDCSIISVDQKWQNECGIELVSMIRSECKGTFRTWILTLPPGLKDICQTEKLSTGILITL